MTQKPQQRSLFDLVAPPVPAVGPRAVRLPAAPRDNAQPVRPGRHPVIQAQHKKDKETLDERFARWIEANPAVLEVFIERAEQYRSQGRKKIGAKRIVEDMRWDERLWTAGDPFKINNVFVSRLARLAVSQRPHLAGFFEFRELQS